MVIPKEFTEQIADELSVLSDSPILNYYYGSESSVFTISTLDSYKDLKDNAVKIKKEDNISYVTQ